MQTASLENPTGWLAKTAGHYVAFIILGLSTADREVRQLVLEWQRRGALIFGLSDKPDEATLPTREQAERGGQPLHRTRTHAVGA